MFRILFSNIYAILISNTRGSHCKQMYTITVRRDGWINKCRRSFLIINQVVFNQLIFKLIITILILIIPLLRLCNTQINNKIKRLTFEFDQFHVIIPQERKIKKKKNAENKPGMRRMESSLEHYLP